MFRVIAGISHEVGLVGEVAKIPASNGDAFEGVITRNENDTRDGDRLIGATLSYPWEHVEPLATEVFAALENRPARFAVDSEGVVADLG